MKRIAFQGEKGAYSEEAAYSFSKDAGPVPQSDFKSVFTSVDESNCDFGIVPIENALTGSIHENVDLLLAHDLFIIGEVVLRIRHHLLALPGVHFDDIKKVYSHPQGLGQCSAFLAEWQGIETAAVYDTAGSAKMIKENQYYDAAAIACARAAEEYGLNILEKNIENNAQNYTRFVVLSKTKSEPRPGGKTSIVFSAKDMPGALFKCLAAFSLRDINLYKIESRPLIGKPWSYYFYLDFAGHENEPHCRNALLNLEEMTDYLRILGSYPAGNVDRGE